MEDRGLSNIIPSPTPHVWPSLDDLMKGTPTGVPLGSCLCKRTPATCGRRCIMGRRSTSRGKNTMMRSPGIGISDLVLGIIVQKSSNIIIKTDGLGFDGKSFTGTLSPHRTLLSMQAWALLTKPTCRWVYLISDQFITNVCTSTTSYNFTWIQTSDICLTPCLEIGWKLKLLFCRYFLCLSTSKGLFQTLHRKAEQLLYMGRRITWMSEAA